MEWISSNGIRYDTRFRVCERAKQGHGDRRRDAEFRTPSPVNWVMEEIFCGKVFLLSHGRSRTAALSNWNQFPVPLNNSCDLSGIKDQNFRYSQ
jgi:hypothetical protein